MNSYFALIIETAVIVNTKSKLIRKGLHQVIRFKTNNEKTYDFEAVISPNHEYYSCDFRVGKGRLKLSDGFASSYGSAGVIPAEQELIRTLGSFTLEDTLKLLFNQADDSNDNNVLT